MAARKLLIVHESTVIRNLVKGYILAELTDIKIEELRTGPEAEKRIFEDKYDIIISPAFMRDYDGVVLQKKKKSSDTNADTPLLVITSTDTKLHLSELKENGIEHFLVVPFSASQLRDKINELCDPRLLRQQERYNIPGTSASIHFESGDIQANVINFSLSSIFCEFNLPKNNPDLMQSVYVSLQFPEECKKKKIGGIFCKILSVKTVSWGPNETPEKVRVIWLFKEIPKHKTEEYNQLIDDIEKRNKEAEHNFMMK